MPSIQEKFEPIREQMEAMHAEIAERIGDGSIVETQVPYVADADRLDGMDANRVKDLLRQRVREHIESLSVNAHGITPGDLGAYNNVEISQKLDSYAGIDDVGPLSFYGDREYLPPTVTGSFEAGVNWTPYGMAALYLEDNDTLMMLRTGTDGSSAGVYYSYVRNASVPGNLEKMVMTNVRYQPSYFPAGQVAKAVLWGGKDILIGILMNRTTKAHTGYFVSLLNNTFDQTKHNGFVIPLNGIFAVVEADNRKLYGVPMGYLRGNTVTFLVKGDIFPGLQGYVVYDVPKNDLINGTYNGATQRINWTINRGGAGTVNVQNLILADDILDLVSPTSRVGLVHSTLENHGDYVHVDENNRVWLTCGGYKVMRQLPDRLINDSRLTTYMTVEITDNKVIDVSRYFNNKPTIDIVNSAFVIENVGVCESRASSNHLTDASDASTRFFITDNDQAFRYFTSVAMSNRSISRFKYPSGTSYVNKARAVVAPTSSNVQTFDSRYASPVTFMFRLGYNIGNNVLGAWNVAYNAADVLQTQAFRVGHSGAYTYTYDSITKYNYLGFPPTSDRKFVTAIPGGISPIRLVNECDSGGYKVHQGRFDSIVYPSQKTGAANVDTNLQATGTLSISAAAFDGLRTQIVNYLSTLNHNASASNMLWYEVILPQRFSEVPAFVVGLFINQRDECGFFIGSLSVNSRTACTSASLVTSTVKLLLFGGNDWLFMDGGIGSAGQVAIRQVTGGYALGISTTGRPRNAGYTGDTTVMINYRVASGWEIVDLKSNASLLEIHNFYNSPAHGLMMTYSSETIGLPVDAGTKMLATAIATTALINTTFTQILDRLENQPSATRILLSQTNVSAWTVYFADPVPAMVDGMYREMPIQSIDLNPATDANKTFRVWLVKDGTELKYHLTTTTAIPTGFAGVLYLGYFTTTDEGIAVVDIQKRVAVGGFIISKDDRGLSIPVTSGVPSSAGRLNWR